MKTFKEFMLECELVEGKVEWDNPRRPLQSGLTPREKNRAKRISTGVENPNRIPSEKSLDRYGKLKIAHDDEKGKKVSRGKRHKFDRFITGLTNGQANRTFGAHIKDISKLDPKRKDIYKNNSLKEPKENYDYSIDEGRIPWDDKNRPLRSGWTPREKNRAKRISTGVENPEQSPSDKKLERYGKLKSAHDDQRNVKTRRNQRHKDLADYGLGRNNFIMKDAPRMPSENIKGHDNFGVQRVPRNSLYLNPNATKDDFKKASEDMKTRKFGAAKDEQRDKYYEKGPKGLKEPK